MSSLPTMLDWLHGLIWSSFYAMVESLIKRMRLKAPKCCSIKSHHEHRGSAGDRADRVAKRTP